jgi:hypothetical protein
LKGANVDRQIVYPGGIPLDTDILNIERNVMAALGYLAQAVLGTATVADGLACTATAPASMNVTVGPGSVTQYGAVDTLPFGSLPAEAGQPLLRMGVNLMPTSFALSAPTISGDAINYLVEASLLESDATPVVLPYYNATNPAQPYSGPANTGSAQNTQRLQRVQLQIKAGPASAIGTQQTPAVDAGWVGLYAVTVAAGATSITAANIATLPSAPFINIKLPQQTPGTHNLAVFTPISQGNWTVPAGITAVKLRIWAGGGAGGAGFGGAGGGGGGGGYCEAFLSVSPGQAYFVTVGNGGIGSGTVGGTSKFGTLVACTGGTAGANGASGVGGAGGNGGAGGGGGMLVNGQIGGPAFPLGSNWVSGRGGGAFAGAGAEPVLAAATSTTNGFDSTLPGAGGAGGVGNGLGGQGGPGLVLIEW